MSDRKGGPSKERVMYEIASKRDDVVDWTPEFRAYYVATLKCSVCNYPGPGWMADPKAVDVEIARTPRGCIAVGGGFKYIHTDLLDLLRPHFPDALVGRCFVKQKGDRSQVLREYATCCVPPTRAINAERGPYCRHRACKGCGRIWNAVGWAGRTMVERDLDERMVYQDLSSSLYMDACLVEQLSLKERFPDLKLNKFPVVPEPLDGDTLPGDPGWDGVIRRRMPAELYISASFPGSWSKKKEETVQRELWRRLNNELAAIGLGEALLDHGLIYARGLNTASLKGATLRALRGWRVRAWFRIQLSVFDEPDDQIEEFEIECTRGDAV